MRFMAGFLLVLFGIVFVQSAPVVRQATDSLVDPDAVTDNVVLFINEMADLLPPDQFALFQMDLFVLMNSRLDGNKTAEEIEAEFLTILQKYFSSDLRNRSDFQEHVQKFVDTVIGVLPDLTKNINIKRQATDSLVNMTVFYDNLYQFNTEMADLLSPDQYHLFREDLFQLVDSGSTGEMNAEEIEAEFLIILQKYVSSDLRSRSDFQEHVQKFVDTVIAVLPDLAKTTNSKRQATDDLDAILATVPELSVLINPLNDALAQLARFLAPDRLKSLKELAIQLILSLAAHNIDANQFKERFQALLQYYLNSNGKNDVDIDQLIQNVVGTDTEGLPNVILEILSQHQQ